MEIVNKALTKSVLAISIIAGCVAFIPQIAQAQGAQGASTETLPAISRLAKAVVELKAVWETSLENLDRSGDTIKAKDPIVFCQDVGTLQWSLAEPETKESTKPGKKPKGEITALFNEYIKYVNSLPDTNFDDTQMSGTYERFNDVKKTLEDISKTSCPENKKGTINENDTMGFSGEGYGTFERVSDELCNFSFIQAGKYAEGCQP